MMAIGEARNGGHVTSEPTAAEALTRRDRARAATTEEIKQTARRILVAHGPDAVSLRAIAREMGMTAPALYRYFDSREVLIRSVIADIFNELTADVTQAIQTAARERDDDLTKKMVGACREFREWALAHEGEFALIFGSPLPGVDDGRGDVADECGRQFAGVYFALFREMWTRSPFPVPAPDEIDPGLRTQLERFGTVIHSDLPLGAILRFLRCWTKLYGAVSMEVFGHIGFALDDAAPMFDLTLAELATDLGLEYRAGKN
jgi:AcrR family transcriptional regulator